MTDNATRYGRWMFIAFWLVVLGLLTVLFNGYMSRQHNPNAGAVVREVDGAEELRLQANRRGHYVASGAINGEPVVFLLDTGATDVAVPEGLADELGLERGAPLRYQTANGTVIGYTVMLDRVELGGLVLRNVRGHISPGLGGDEILLGMSFLRRLELTQRGDQLILRHPGSDG